MQPNTKRVERSAAAIVLTIYVAACLSDVVRAGLSGGPFDSGPIGGLYCALLGWLDFPVAWLANPLIWAGVVFLLCSRPRAATLCGVIALVPVVHWSAEWHARDLWHMLRAGYYLWVTSVVLLIVGGGVGWARCRHPSRSFSV